MADRNLVGDNTHQQHQQPKMRPPPIHPTRYQNLAPHLNNIPPHHQVPQQQPSQHMPRHNTHFPRQPLPHQQPPMQYPMRGIPYPTRMNMPPGPLDQNLQQYYQAEGRIPQTQLPPGVPRQNFGPMPPYMNAANPPIYGQTTPSYMPQNMYMGPNPYATSVQPAPARPQYTPVKRERKVLKIVNPETNEVVTSSKSSTSSAPPGPQAVPVAAPVSTPTVPRPVSATPPSLTPYQQGPSKALEIEVPSAAPQSYSKPPSKALKIEAPPPEDTKPAPPKDAPVTKPMEVNSQSVNGTREVAKLQESNATPNGQSLEKKNTATESQTSFVSGSPTTSGASKTPSSPKGVRLDSENTKSDEDRKEVDSVSVSLEKLNLSDSKQTTPDSAEPKVDESSKVSTAPPQSKGSMEVERLTVPPSGALATMETKSAVPEKVPSTSSISATSDSPKPDAQARNNESFAENEKNVGPLVEAVTPEVSKKSTSDSPSAPSADVSNQETKSEEPSWRSSTTPSQDAQIEKSWRDKNTDLNLSGMDNTPSGAGAGEDGGRTPMKRQRPEPVTHTPGSRRAYALQWLEEMRIFCMDTKAPVEAQKAGIAKGFPSSKSSTPSSRGQGGRGGPGGGAQWTRGQQFPSVFSGAAKGGNQYVHSDRGPRRGVKLPPVPSPQAQSWRGSGRTNDFPGMNRGPPLPPVEPLKKSENAWSRKKEDDDVVAVKRKTVRSILNKLTPEKFERLYKQLIAVEIATVDVLDAVVREIFEKAVLEPKFAGMYAELCQRLSKETAKMLAAAKLVGKNGKPITFKRVMVTNVVQKEFQSFANAEKLKKEALEHSRDAAKGEQSAEEKREQAERDEQLERNAVMAKRRMLGNINFIGELYKQSLIPEIRIHKDCVQKLLNLGIETREDEVLEALCKLLTSVGQKLSENKNAKEYMDRYFEELDKLSRDHSLPSRIRFMMQNLIEMRQNNWKRRREEVKAKKISEVHADIQREERAKQEASSRTRGRGGGSRYQSRYDRPHRVPAPAMTMAPERRNAPSVSRAVKQRERFNVPMGAQARSQLGSGDARLTMPGPRRTFGAAGGGSSMALKPGGSTRFTASNSYSALGDMDDATSQGTRGARLDRIGQVNSMLNKRSVGTKGPSAPTKPENTGLDAQKIKHKARSYIEEYLSIEDLKEAKECVQSEVPKVNHTAFVDASLRYALNLKPQDGGKLLPLFVGYTSIIPGTCYQTAFEDIIGTFDDLEMDAPNAGIFVSKCLGRLSALGKLSTSPSDTMMGLGFLRKTLEKLMDGKRVLKLVIRTFAELAKSLEPQISDKTERESRVYSVFASLGLDLKAIALKWNPARGATVLSDLLSEYNVQYLEPLIGVDEKVKEMLAQGKSEDVAQFVKTAVPATSLKSARLVQLLVGEGLEFACQSTKKATKDSLSRAEVEEESRRFKSNVVPMLIGVFGNAETENFSDVRFAVVLETQRFCYENEFPPGLPDAENGEHKLIARLLFYLYDSEVVEEDVLRRWKEDLSESDKIGGKAQALVQSQRFFNWLETAETEE